jgi:hypothetical protein
VKSQQPLPPGRRYSKTELRRGAVKPAQTPARPTHVAADEQAALFGEAESPDATSREAPHKDSPRTQR